MVSRRPVIVMQRRMAWGETTLSREINPRDRRCFQRIISFGSESWPPAGCLTAIFFLTLSSFSFFIYRRIYLCAISIPMLSLSRSKLTLCCKTRVNEIYLTILGFREKPNFSLFEEGSQTFPGKSDATGLRAFTDMINRQSRTGRMAMVLRVKTGQGWRKK